MFISGIVIVIFKDLIFLLLESSYRSAAGLTSFLLLMPIIDTVSYVTTVGINFKKKTYLYIIRATIAAIINVVGNIFLVPKYGAEGAALSTAISYVVYFFIGTYFSQKLYPVNYHLSKFYISTFVFLLVSCINTFIPIIYLQVISAVVGFVIICYLYKDQIFYLLNITKAGVDKVRKSKTK
jgi:O-antigen/teichoic acid export membrane protein